LDSLAQKCNSDNGFMIIDRYMPGFEFHHWTSFLVVDKFNNHCRGVDYSWSDSSPIEVDNSTAIISRNISFKYSFTKKNFKLGRYCFTDYVYIINIPVKSYFTLPCSFKLEG
jgi:hypothetical protein